MKERGCQAQRYSGAHVIPCGHLKRDNGWRKDPSEGVAIICCFTGGAVVVKQRRVDEKAAKDGKAVQVGQQLGQAAPGLRCRSLPQEDIKMQYPESFPAPNQVRGGVR